MKLNKSKRGGVTPANAEADIAIIRQHAISELTPEKIFCFNVVLCDNENDRDSERFSDKALEKLAELFVGKTGIHDHMWLAGNQIARIYRCVVNKTKEKTSDGRQLKQLVASAYMVRTASTADMIASIEAGILKEVSVGVSVRNMFCSVCGKPMRDCEHRKGETYDGVECIGILDEPEDAYEFSFVAVPAQPGAGVTKGAEEILPAFRILLDADLSDYAGEVEKLLPRLQTAMLTKAERDERAALIAENSKYIKTNM